MSGSKTPLKLNSDYQICFKERSSDHKRTVINTLVHTWWENVSPQTSLLLVMRINAYFISNALLFLNSLGHKERVYNLMYNT